MLSYQHALRGLQLKGRFYIFIYSVIRTDFEHILNTEMSLLEKIEWSYQIRRHFLSCKRAIFDYNLGLRLQYNWNISAL